MAALSGEPWRALSKIHITETVGGAVSRFMASIDTTVAITDTGDQDEWEGTPGQSFTMRFVKSEAIAASLRPDLARVSVRVPGDASNIGDVWSITLNPATDSESFTRTFHFDSNPLNQADDADRWGMLEIFVDVSRTAAVSWGPFDSRGTGPTPVGTTGDNARGYVRAAAVLTGHSLSNASLGGAEPASWAFPDTVFARATLNAQNYGTSTISRFRIRNQSGVQERNQNRTGNVVANWDYTLSGTAGVDGANRIAEGMTLSSELKDIRLTWDARDFGGDNEYIWATTGQEAGWVRIDELTLERADRITVDPRLTWAYHMQFDANDFATPPTSHANTAPDDGRLTSQLAFLAARVTNARGEGQNGITVTRNLRDNNTPPLVGDEAGDSVVTAARGGQDGWEPSFITWDAGLPGGGWTRTQTITAPADATDLDSPVTKTYSLLAPDPRTGVFVALISLTASEDDHLHAGDDMKLVASPFNRDSRKRVASDAGTVQGTLVKYNRTLSRFEYLSTTNVWTHWSGTTTVADSFSLSDAGDGVTWTRDFLSTSAWGASDIVGALVAFKVGGTPYGFYVGRELVGDANSHAEYAFDAVEIFK